MTRSIPSDSGEPMMMHFQGRIGCSDSKVATLPANPHACHVVGRAPRSAVVSILLGLGVTASFSFFGAADGAPRALPRWLSETSASDADCARVRASFDTNATLLAASEGRPTPHLLKDFSENFGFVSRLCTRSASDRHALFQRALDAAGSRLAPRFLSIEFLLRTQPPPLSRVSADGEARLDLAAYLADHSDALTRASREAACAVSAFEESKIPAAVPCYVDWLAWRAVRAERVVGSNTGDFVRASGDRLAKGVSSGAQTLPFGWTLASHSGTLAGTSPLFASKSALEALLVQGSARDRATLLARSSAQLPVVFPWEFELPAALKCERATELATALRDLPKPTATTPEDAARAALFLSRFVFEACPVARRSEGLAAVRAILAPAKGAQGALGAPSSTVDGLSPLGIAETDSRVDLLLRDTLGVRMQLGSGYDLEDLAKAGAVDAARFVRDNLLLEAVRRVRADVPFTHVAESVEDAANQRARLARVGTLLLGGGPGIPSDAKLLFLRQLEFDLLVPFATNEEARRAVIDRLRGVSSAGKAEIPALFPLGFRLHNSMSPALVAALDAFPARITDPKLRSEADPFLVGLRVQLVEVYGLREPTSRELEAGLAVATPPANGTKGAAVGGVPAIPPPEDAARRLSALLRRPLPTAESARFDTFREARLLWSLVQGSAECKSVRAGGTPTGALAALFEDLGAAPADQWDDRTQRVELFVVSHAARRTLIPELAAVRSERLSAFPALARGVVSASPCDPAVPRPGVALPR